MIKGTCPTKASGITLPCPCAPRLSFLILAVIFLQYQQAESYHFSHEWDPNHVKYAHFSERERLEMLGEARKMFQFGYDNYMNYAFPADELDPIHCTGRGADHRKP